MKTIEINRKVYDISSPTTEEFKNLYIKSLENISENTIPYFNLNSTNIDGFKIDLRCPDDKIYRTEIYDSDDKLVYSTNLQNGWFCQLNRKYYTKWKTKLFDGEELVYEEKFSLKGKRVFIVLDSSSLGDSLAWIPYCEIFAKKHECHVIVSTFRNELYKKQYPNLEFVEPGSTVNNIHALYKIGWFYNSDMEPEYPNTIPLQKTATNILGLNYQEIRPKLNFFVGPRPYSGKYVTIGTTSTSGCKTWTDENWQEIINKITSKGYKVAVIQKEPMNGFKYAMDWTGDISLHKRMNQLYYSEFYIGLGSGLSWLAWAMNKHVVMISNFSEEGHEFTENTTRIKNTSVCHGCWNNPLFKFDKGDWNWCPEHKGTDRQFECQKSITPEMVMEQIEHLLV